MNAQGYQDAGCGCGQKLGAQSSARVVWLEQKYIYFGAGANVYLSADEWLDCRDWLDAYVAVEYAGSGGANLTVSLETAVAPNDGTAWGTVTGASSAMTNGVATLIGKSTAAIPPTGVLRLKFAATAALSGAVRVVVCFKQVG
jgi:hypothetical protein